jgi:hypothetical protein
MARAIFSIVAGLIVAVVCVFAMEYITHIFHPAPPGFDPRDKDAVRALVAGLPLLAFILVLFGWLLGAGLGAFMAVRINRRIAKWPGLLIGALLLAATLYNLLTIPHPVWFFVAAVIGIPIATWLGTNVGYGNGPVRSPMQPLPAA